VLALSAVLLALDFIGLLLIDQAGLQQLIAQ
jgi:hypothetical protein